jgi:hypothetical protein
MMMMSISGRMLVQAHSMIRPGGLCFLAVRLTVLAAEGFRVDRKIPS